MATEVGEKEQVRLKPGQVRPPQAAKVIYEIQGAICQRCDYEWIPRKWPPVRCARCGDPKWQYPYIYNVADRGPRTGRVRTQRERDKQARAKRGKR